MRIRTIVVLLGALATGGCAGTPGGAQGTVAESEATQEDPCRAAIDDVTTFCAEDNFSRGKCNDAKTRSRELCI